MSFPFHGPSETYQCRAMGHLWTHGHQDTFISIATSAWTAFGPYCSPALCLVFVQVEHLWAEITEQTAWVVRRPGWVCTHISESVSYLAPGSPSFDSFMADTKENQYEGKGLTFHFLKSDPLRANHQAVFISLGKWHFLIGGGGEGIISKQLDRLNSPRWRLIIRNLMYPAINPALNNKVINKSGEKIKSSSSVMLFSVAMAFNKPVSPHYISMCSALLSSCQHGGSELNTHRKL